MLERKEQEIAKYKAEKALRRARGKRKKNIVEVVGKDEEEASNLNTQQ